MASKQVALVVETENKAIDIEREARLQAQEILDLARATALSNREASLMAVKAQSNDILLDAQTQVEAHLQKETLLANEQATLLHSVADQYKDQAKKAAINLLIGRA